MDTHSIAITLAAFTSSQTIYSYNHQNCLVTYSEGIKFLQDNTNCSWLIDEIASYQTPEFCNKNTWQCWQINIIDFKSENCLVILTCGINSRNLLISKNIEGDDFPLPYLSIWVETFPNRIFMYLPSEY